MNNINKQRIRYIFEHYEDMLNTIGNLSFEELKKNKILFKAAQMDIAQIGEHIINLKPPLKNFIAEKDIGHMHYVRNHIIHEYKNVDEKDLKEAIDVCIPRVIDQLKKLANKNYYLK